MSNGTMTALKAAILGGLIAAASPAFADEARPRVGHVIECAARAQLVQMLESRYGEVFSGESYEAEQGVVELFVAQSGSWTLLLTFPSGQSCPVAIGADAERDFNRKDLIGQPV